MPKANQKANKKPRDLTKVNASFDSIISTIDNMADGTRELMPLVADSLELTKKLVKLYKEAFNKGLDNYAFPTD